MTTVGNPFTSKDLKAARLIEERGYYRQVKPFKDSLRYVLLFMRTTD